MLLIQFTKQLGGAVVIRCTRSDGSTSWQKQTKHAAHFILHDLTHYAVETTLGYRQAFFGLIADGWNIEDTTGKGARGPLPLEAIEAETIVGLFDSERAYTTLWTEGEFNSCAPRSLSAAEIKRIRDIRDSLFQKWFALEPDQKLELTFQPSTGV